MMKRDLQFLIQAVERKIGKTVGVTSDFERLAVAFSKHRIEMSGKVLKHVWGYLKGSEKPSIEVLDKLALFAGFQNWSDFQKALHGKTDAEINYEEDSQDAS